MKKFLILLLMCTLACTRDDTRPNPPFSVSEMWEVYHNGEWTAASVSSALHGQWQWVYTVCCPEGELTGKDTGQEGLRLLFYDDGTLTVQQPGRADIQTSWTLAPNSNDETFTLETASSITHLYGRILFKGEYLLFHNSYVDGADNYFRRL